jgi:hypothetical protein
MRLGKVSMAMLAFGGLAVLFSGCLSFKGQPEAKQIKDDQVRIKVRICGQNASDPGDCPVGNKGPSVDEETGEITVLAGLRVPKGSVKVPRKIEAGQTDLVLTKDADFKRELNQVAPKGNKYKWFGYSGTDTFTADSPDARVKFLLKLNKKFDKKSLKYRPTVGWRQVDAPSDCGADPFEFQGSVVDGDGRICINDPTRDETEKHLKVKIKKKD